MTRDDIIKLAAQVGFGVYHAPQLERFSALVIAAERARMIEDGWRQCAKGQRTTQFCGQLEQALIAEREACAKVIDAKIEEVRLFMNELHLLQCASAIRARGQE